MLTLFLTVLAAYLIGAIPFGYLVARARGIDILHVGSGNIGATNVGRVLGRRFGLLVFALDFLKGALPTVAAAWLGRAVAPPLPPHTLPMAAGLATLMGHVFPVYLGFHGGKGVATGAGVVAVLLPVPALGALFVWVAVVSSTRYVSLASLTAALALCTIQLLMPEPFAAENELLTGFCLLAAGLVLVRHRANLQRLLQGKENRLRENPAMSLVVRMLHVIGLGLWFGMAVFFTFVVGLSLFGTFQPLAESKERPLWFPLAEPFNRDPQVWGPEGTALFKDAQAVRREQGTRAAGAAVGPMFRWYYWAQLLCATLAGHTALVWWLQHTGRLHAIRLGVVIAALLTAGAGFRIEREVAERGQQRNDAVDAVLQSAQPTAQELQQATQLAHDFVRWHLYSLFLNLGTVALVTVAMALTACLPRDAPLKDEATPSPGG